MQQTMRQLNIWHLVPHDQKTIVIERTKKTHGHREFSILFKMLICDSSRFQLFSIMAQFLFPSSFVEREKPLPTLPHELENLTVIVIIPI